MNQAMQDFVDGRRVAGVGASPSSLKFGNIAAAELRARGYQTYVVHPKAESIDGERCYANLSELQGQIDGVVISVPPQQAAQVLRDAVSAGVKNIWLQAGAESSAVLALAQELGVEPVTGKCILMYAQPVRSYHRLHRAVCWMTGKL
jgi:uncharacterized protein